MTVFAILCHGEPERLSFLLKALEGFEVIVHIDKFANRQAISTSIRKNNLDRVTIIPEAESIRGSWGGYSLVEIQLRLIQEFLSQTSRKGPLIFLSGQDFPIKPLSEFISYLDTKENFFSIQMLDYSKVAAGDSREVARLNRIRKLHFQDIRFFQHCKDRNKLRYKLGSLPSAFLRSIKIPNPNFKGNPPFFIGSQWVALSKSTCQLLLDNSKSLKSEFRFAFCPDEIAFQSLYGRNNNTEIRKNKVNESSFDSVIEADFHLIHPSLNHFWDIWEFDYVIKSPKFFIRKPSWELLLKLNATAITE